jgi:hypothetical protein
VTNPINGEQIVIPSKAAVAEHVFTLPMALAVFAFFCGAIAAAGFFPHDSAAQKLLLYIVSGMPLLIAQLGQLWHSRNVRNKISVANGSETVTEQPLEGRTL